MTTADPAAAPQPADDDSKARADDEWKQRVKADDAAMDAALKAEAAEAKTSAPEEPSETHSAEPAEPGEEASERRGQAFTMPPATFEIMVSMFSTQAMVALGALPNPATGKAEKMPELAQHFIDLLGVLETKTAGNLEPHEKTLLDASLHQLRMAYVEATKK